MTQTNKTAVVTVTIGDVYTQLAKLTHPSLKRYAEKINADFVVIDHTHHHIPHYSKCSIKDLLQTYDRICYLDTDIIVHPHTPNIFDVVPAHKLGMFEESQFYPERKTTLINSLIKQQLTIPSKVKYYNTGVIVASQAHASLFELPHTIEDQFYEQTHLNVQCVIGQFDMFDLDWRFNRLYGLNDRLQEHHLNSYFLHYAGALVGHPPEQLFAGVQSDLAAWSQGAFSNKKCIHVLNIGNYFPQLTKITLPLIERYAGRIGADVNIIRERRYPDYPITYEKMQIHDLGQNYNWNILMDADLLVDPSAADITLRPRDRVYSQYVFKCSEFFEPNRYFIRDGRNLALCAFFVISTDLTHDLWEPLQGDWNHNQHRSRKSHIIDEYCISNNMAKYGLKHDGIGMLDSFVHAGATTDRPLEHKAILKQAKQFAKRVAKKL